MGQNVFPIPQAAPSGIKSVQRGSITMAVGAATVTISAVNMSKAFVKLNSALYGGSTDNPTSIYLSNSTTLTVYAGTSDQNTKTAYWEVVEFN